MKNAALSLLFVLFLFSTAIAVNISPETGETIPGQMIGYNAEPSSSSSSLPDNRDVGSWTGSGPWGGNVRSIITDLSNPMHVFASCGSSLVTLVGGVYESNDGGINWQATTLQGKPVFALANSFTQPGVFYAGARNGLYKTTDNGVSWNLAGLSTAYILGVGVDPFNGSTIVVGKSSNVGLVVSTDGGTTFNQVGVNAGYMREFNYCIANPRRMFVVIGSSSSSVLTSTNGGLTWSPYGPTGDGWGMYCSPTDSLFNLVAHSSGIYKTTDGGLNWSQRISGTFRSVVHYNGIFYGTSNAGGVYESNDQGDTWQNYNTGIVQSTWQTGGSTGSGALLGHWGGIFRATGYQVPIVTSHAGINNAFVHGLAYYADTNELWAGTEGSGMYRSLDGGVTWEQKVDGLNNWMVYEMAPSNHEYYLSGRMLAATLNGVYTSIDGGNHWTFVDYPSMQCIALEVHPTDPDQFWIGTSAGEIKYTSNGGLTWRVATGGQFGFAPKLKLGRGPTGNLRLFLSYQGSATAIWYSDDDGATFVSSTGMEGTSYQPMVSVRPSLGEQPQIVYAASDLGIYKSTDNGATFALSGLTGFSWSVMNSPGLQVISGKDNGLGYSTNEGQTAASLTQNLTNTTVWAMAWGSSTNEVFIATKGKGVMENRFNDFTYFAPTGLSSVAGNEQVTLSWIPLTTTPLPIAYHIWRDGYPVHETTIEESAWTDTGLINDQTYKYFMTAVYEGNIETSPTEVISVTPVVVTYPAPFDLTAIVNGLSIDLSWSMPEGANPTGFKVYRNGVLIMTLNSTPLSWTVTNQAPGNYTFFVTAIYPTGESAPSNPVTVEIVGNHDNTQSALISSILSIGPNPFCQNTSIRYLNSSKQAVDISIYNLHGQFVKSIISGTKEAGLHNELWNCWDSNDRKVASGVYLITLRAGDKVSTKKVTLIN